ncbi:MAG: limonene-1,2-epoxide hydrolase family protein [Pseudomonadales bacterium]
MLQQTLQLLRWRQTPEPLRATLVPALQAQLRAKPLAKPVDHRGGPGTDMLCWTPAAEPAAALLDLIKKAESAEFRTSGTMARGLGGFEEAWQEYLAALSSGALQTGDIMDNEFSTEGTMGTATQRVVAMIEAWNRMDLDGIAENFASDAVYHNIPMEPVYGADAIRESLSGFLAMANQIQWDILNIAEDDNGVVLTERVDRFKIGERWLEIPVMGTFEVSGDRINAWRDYFDLADFQSQMAAISG